MIPAFVSPLIEQSGIRLAVGAFFLSIDFGSDIAEVPES